MAQSGRGTRAKKTRSTVAGAGRAVVPPGMPEAPPSQCLALELRYMFDAAGMITALEMAAQRDPASDSHLTDSVDPAARQLAEALMQRENPPVPTTTLRPDAAVGFTELRPANPAQNQGRREVAFIDSRVADYQALVDGVKPGVAVVLLGGQGDGLTQMAAWACTHSDYDALHVLSHGSEGQVHLGSFTLDTTTVEDRADDLATIGGALKTEGDLLLYGCDVAAGDGPALITRLAAATGADVAASDDPTGAAHLGGDWNLERTVGYVDSDVMSNYLYQYSLDTVTFVEGSAEDTAANDSGVRQFQRTISGATFTFKVGSTITGQTDGGYFDIQTNPPYAASGGGIGPGIYALSTRNSNGGVDFEVSVQSGYTFDITGFKTQGTTGTVTVYYLLNGNATTQTKTFSPGADTYVTYSSITEFNDVTAVVFTSEDYLVIQDIIITDVKTTSSAPTVSLSVNNASIAEAAGTSTVTATLSAAASTDTTVTLTASGTATGSGTDYTLASNTITITAGQTTGTTTVTAVQDTTDEANETVILDISGVSGGDSATENGTQQSTVTITDDDAAPTVSIATPSAITEGNSGSSNLTFTVNLSAASGQAITVDYATSNNTATAGSDYTATNGTLSFAAGDTSKTFNVAIAGDTSSESDETFTATLSNPTNATLGTTTATGTITNDEGPSISSIVRAGSAAQSTNASSVSYTVTFSESVTGVDTSDFALTASGVSGASVTGVSGSGTTWTVTASTGTGDGTLRLDLNSSGTGIQNGSSTAISGGYTSGESYTIDKTAPTKTITTTGLNWDTGPLDYDYITNTAAQTIYATLSASLAAGEILYGSVDGGSTWTNVTSMASGTNISWTSATLNAGTSTIRFKVTDAAGNDGTVASQTYTLDTISPVVSISNGTAFAYTENDAATAIAGTPTLTEAGSPGLASLVVRITANNESTDALSLPTSASTGINISGTSLRSDTTNIGTVTVSSVSNGTSWTLSFLSTATAQNIQDTIAAIRYYSSSDNPGTSNRTVSYTLTDGAGNAGTAATRSVAVTRVNDAPVLSGNGTLTAVNEDTASPSGAALSALGITANDTSDSGSIGGYAIVGNSANSSTEGAWQYSPDSGSNWFAIGTVADGATALALSSSTLVRFVPVSNYNGTPTSLTIRALDNSYSAGYSSNTGATETRVTVNTSSNGTTTNISSATATISTSITAVNDAPTLSDTTVTMSNIAQNAGTPSGAVGNLVSTLVAIATNVTDVDSSPSTGIAVTALDTTTDSSGTWYYSVDNGSNWSTVGAVAANSALLLRPADRIYFKPGGSYAGALSTAITFRAWDQTSGTQGNKVDASSNGGSTAFSTATDTASFTITPAAPSGTPDLAAGSDAGTSSTDNTTNVSSADFTVSGANASATVRLYAGGTQIASTTADGSGNASFTSVNVSTLTGVTSITARQLVGSDESTDSTALSVTFDRTAPTVSSVTAPSNGSYKTGDNLDFTVNFSEAVTVVTTGGTPYITVTVGSTSRQASYSSGSGSTALVFRYTVQSGDTDTDGVALASSITLNSGTIKDTAGNDASLTLANVGATTSVLTDTTAPTISSVAVPTSGSYKASQNLDFTVTFSEAVTVVTTGGTPRLAVTVGSTTRYATYTSGSGTTALVFRYTTQSGDTDSDGIALAASLDLNSGTIKDTAGNDATLTLNSVASTTAVLVDTTAPTVSSVTAPSNGTYRNSQNLDFTVNFSEAVTVVTTGGTPYISLTVGSTSRQASYVSGSGTTALVFRYTVQSGETDNDGVTLGASITLNSGTIRDTATNDATLTLNSVGATTAVLVDGTAPAVTAVSVPSNGSYKVGDALNFTVTYSEAVTVVTTGGTPRIALTIGSTTRYADYVSGSGTTALVFRYTVVSGDTDSDGIAVGTLATNGGTMQSGTAVDAVLTLNSVASTAAVLVDTTAPAVSSVSVPSNGTYCTGQNLDFTVNMSEATTVVTTGGTPYITVTVGSTSRQASYVSGSGTTALVFRYTVQSGDTDSNGVELGSSLTLNSGTLKDSAGNDASLTLNSVASTTAVLVDTTAPTVSSVAVPSNGTYKASDTLSFTVTMSEAVTVTGTPQIPVTIGSTTRYATYVSGSGTTALVFRYTVQSSESDTDGIAVGSAIDLNSGTLKDAAGNDATLTLNSVASTTAVLVDAVAPAAPSTPDLAAGSDSGSSSTDNLTNVSLPVFSGTAEAGSTVKLYSGATQIGSATADGSGNWSITASTALSTGAQSITATATDAAGNVSPSSVGLSVTYDGTAPSAPSSLTLASASDSGSSSSDRVTRTTTPLISGSAEAGSTVALYSGTTLIGTATADANGAWSITTSTLSDGNHSLTARATDAAGNSSVASSTLSLTIDTSVPATPTAPTLDSASDSGTSNSDRITNVTTPVIRGSAEANSVVTVYDGSAVIGTVTADGLGSWTLTTSALSDGVHTITVAATDAAGNTGSASSGLTLTIDTIAPAAVSAPDLTDATDSGSSNSDNITAASRPVLVGTAEAGSVIRLYDGASQVASTTADGSGNWSITLSGLSSGSHTLGATATDTAGNVNTVQRTLTVTMIGGAPSAPSTPALASASDSGDSSSDAITYTTAPVFSGTAEANSTVKLYSGTTLIGTVTADSGGAWSLTASTLGQGRHEIGATATNAAGLTSGMSGRQVVVIDNQAPSAPSLPDLVAGSDSGPSNSDNITSATTPTLVGRAEPGSLVRLYSGSSEIGSVRADGAGNWSITSSALSNGVQNLTATATDVAGNVSGASSALAVTVDGGAPGAPAALDLTTASDSGRSDSDNITRASPLTITGQGEPGSVVRLYSDGSVVGTVTVGGDGRWSLPVSGLGQGTRTLTATATDAAGNVSSASDPLSVTFDSQAPSAPDGLDLADADDSGTSASDNLTSATSPNISGGAEAGSTVRLYNGTTLIGTVTADNNGRWSLPAANLAPGVYRFTATATDAAGNISPTTTAPLVVTIDTSGPSTPGLPDLLEASDSGASNSDNITRVGSPNLGGTAEPGSVVKIYDGSTLLGTTTADPSGRWTLGVGPLSDGEHTLAVTATDGSGNVSPTSPGLVLRVDSRGPDAPSLPDLADASDSGTLNTDNITTNTRPLLNGRAEPGSRVALYDNGTLIATVLADSSGNWSSSNVTFSPGNHRITTTATDPAGNVGPTSEALALVIDGTPPVAAPAPDLQAASDSGLSDRDDITNAAAPVLTGTAEPGSTVTLFDNGTRIGTVVADASGAWSYSASGLSDGTHRITTTTTDIAGNTGPASAVLPLTLDRSVIPPSTPVLLGGNSSNTLSNTTPTLTGTGEPGSTLRLYDGETLVGTVVVDRSGNWSVTTTALATGTHSLRPVATDPAGNSAAGTALSLTIDTLVPSIPDLVAAADSGRSDNDNLTNLTTPTFRGTAEPGSSVRLMAGDSLLGSGTTDGSGNWSVTVSTAMSAGSYAVRAVATNSAGTLTRESGTLAVVVDTVAPSVSLSDVQTSSGTTVVAGGLTNQSSLTLRGSAEADSELVVQDGGSRIGTLRVGSDGNWSLSPSGLSAATHSFSVSATDAAGNTASSEARSVTVDNSPPSAPTPRLTDGEGQTVSSPSRSGSVTVRGPGGETPGDVIRVYNVRDDGSRGDLLGTVTVGSDGSWSLPLTLGEGTHRLATTATDPAGNESGLSGSSSLTIDSTRPGTPLAELRGDGQTGTTLTPNQAEHAQIGGTAEPGSRITIRLNGEVVGTATTNDGGHWELRLERALTVGAYRLQITATDAAGNVSDEGSLEVRVEEPTPVVTTATPITTTAPTTTPTTTTTSTSTVTSGTTTTNSSGGPGFSDNSSTNGMPITQALSNPGGSGPGPTNAPGTPAGLPISQTLSNSLTPGGSTTPGQVSGTGFGSVPGIGTGSTTTTTTTGTTTTAPTGSSSFAAPAALSTFGVAPITGAGALGGGDGSGAGGNRGILVVGTNIGEQTLRTGANSGFQIPADSFRSTSSQVSLQAKQADGSPLPPWMNFDSATGRFSGSPPPGENGNIAVVVTATDTAGNEASQQFRINVGGEGNQGSGGQGNSGQGNQGQGGQGQGNQGQGGQGQNGSGGEQRSDHLDPAGNNAAGDAPTVGPRLADGSPDQVVAALFGFDGDPAAALADGVWHRSATLLAFGRPGLSAQLATHLPADPFFVEDVDGVSDADADTDANAGPAEAAPIAEAA